MFRLVALDVDGTLLDSQGRLSPANAQAVREALAQGVIVTLATARAYVGAKRLADDLGIGAPLICHNGALVKGGQDGTELLHLRLDLEAAREMVAFGDRRGYRLFTTIDDVSYVRPRPNQAPQSPPPGIRFATEQAPLITSAPTSILVFGEEAAREMRDRFAPKYGEKINFTTAVSATFPHYLVIINSQADKGRALLALCRELGIDPAAAMAVGDTEADVPMLRAVGMGVAMGNAPATVREAARVVAPGNDEDGVAWALRRYVL